MKKYSKPPTQERRCKTFLTLNGWEYDPKNRGGSGAYINGSLVAVEFCDNEIVLLDDSGDFLHLPVNYYALLGVLVDLRQVAMNYHTA